MIKNLLSAISWAHFGVVGLVLMLGLIAQEGKAKSMTRVSETLIGLEVTPSQKLMVHKTLASYTIKLKNTHHFPVSIPAGSWLKLRFTSQGYSRLFARNTSSRDQVVELAKAVTIKPFDAHDIQIQFKPDMGNHFDGGVVLVEAEANMLVKHQGKTSWWKPRIKGQTAFVLTDGLPKIIEPVDLFRVTAENPEHLVAKAFKCAATYHPQTINHLINMLSAKESVLSEQAGFALEALTGQAFQAPAQWLKWWTESSLRAHAQLRMRATLYQSVDTIIKQTKLESEAETMESAKIIVRFGPEIIDLLGTLAGLEKNKDRAMFIRLCRILVGHEPGLVELPDIFEAHKDGQGGSQWALRLALRAAGEFDHRPSLQVVKAQITKTGKSSNTSNSSTGVFREAIMACVTLDRDYVMKQAPKFSESSQPHVRVSLAHAMGAIGALAGDEWLVKLLNDPDATVSAEALLALKGRAGVKNVDKMGTDVEKWQAWLEQRRTLRLKSKPSGDKHLESIDAQERRRRRRS